MINKKKAAIIFGSPKNNGINYECADIIKRLLEKNYIVDQISAYKENIKPCIACNQCLKNPKCIFNDFEKIENKIKNADLLVLISPIYNLGLPAPLKIILDRTQIHFNKRNLKSAYLKPKKALVVLSFGSEFKPYVEQTLILSLKYFFNLFNAQIKNTLCVYDLDKIKDKKKIHTQIKNTTLEFLNEEEML